MKKIIVFTGLVCLGLFSACYYDNFEELYPKVDVKPGSVTGPTNNCDTVNPTTYAGDVAAIMSANCGTNNGSCHNSVASSSGYDLTNYAGVKSIGQSGQLYGVVIHDPNYIAMPYGGGKIDDCSIAKLKRWIANGYAQ